jgi:hypothetical protein
MLLFGELLAPLAYSDDFFGIAQSCGPVEGSSEGLAEMDLRNFAKNIPSHEQSPKHEKNMSK